MRKDREQHKVVIIRRANLIYDVNYESWKIARMRVDDKTLQSETSTDEEADLWLERQIEEAIGRLKGSLRWCLDATTASGYVGDTAIDQDFENPSEGPHYAPDLSIPENDNRIDVGVSEMDTTVDITSEHEPEPTAARFRQFYTIGFKFSSYWVGSLDALKTAIYSYIRSSILAEWFSLVKPDEAPRYAKYADTYLHDAVNYARQERLDGIQFRL